MNAVIQRPQRSLPVRKLLVLWLMVMAAVALIDRTNISIAGIEISREFNIDNPHLGWVFSAFLVGYSLFQIPGGVLARSFGPRRVLTFALIWWAVFTAFTALAPSGASHALLVLILIRVALGAGEAVMFPGANQFVERWIPIPERGRANGIIFSGVGLGSMLAPPVITAIILRHGWRASFWLCAALGLLAAAVWYLAARDTPEMHPRVTAQELETIVSGRGDVTAPHAPAASSTQPKTSVPWKRLFLSKDLLALTASYFCYGYISWIFFSWFYIYLSQVRGLSLATSAIYSMLPFAAMTVGALTGGLSSDWLARHISVRAGRCYLPSFALLLTALLLAAGSSAHGARTASLVLAGGAGALYVSQSSFFSVTADCAGDCAGVASGVMNMGCHIGGAVTALITPLIAAHFGWVASFFAASAMAILGALAWLAVDPKARIGQNGSYVE